MNSPARSSLHPSDEALLRRLGAVALEADPAPDFVLEAARAAWTMRHLDTELAELVYDSAGQTAGVRGAGQRLLTFEFGAALLELQVTARGLVVDLLGQLLGVTGAGTCVRLDSTDGMCEVTVDDNGTFQVGNLPKGPMRLNILVRENPGWSTGWVSV
jgi:hypothetical protein